MADSIVNAVDKGIKEATRAERSAARQRGTKAMAGRFAKKYGSALGAIKQADKAVNHWSKEMKVANLSAHQRQTATKAYELSKGVRSALRESTREKEQGGADE
jgi:hypothetical protein